MCTCHIVILPTTFSNTPRPHQLSPFLSVTTISKNPHLLHPTVVVGSSGSGKTTFLNDVHKSHKCIYIRQYHSIRPYVTVSKIPNFDPTGLPYWEIYQNEKKDKSIQVGGTMAGEFTAGLSGGQRKLLLFELIFQRIMSQNDLLVCLDEPFAGVTDDFVPFIVKRLQELSQKHNILLVTNDHVETLKDMADNTITVSAIDRSTVQVNNLERVPREKAILALSYGNAYVHKASTADLKFFLDVEIVNNASLMGIGIFTAFCFALLIATFWDSSRDSAPLVLIAASIIAFFSLNPYLLALVDWRNFVSEEAEALVHASKSLNKALKSIVVIVLVFIMSLIEFGTVNLVVDGLASSSFWIAMLFDQASLTISFVIFGLYSNLPFQLVEMLASMPFLLMLFFSTTFSPGSGAPGFKELRYLFSRFYFWCMLPQVQDDMENCPSDQSANMLYLVLTGLLPLIVFLVYMGCRRLMAQKKTKRANMEKDALKDNEFLELQVELYGERALEMMQNYSTHSSRSSKSAANNNNNNNRKLSTTMRTQTSSV